MVKTKLFIIFCWFQNVADANKGMVSDGKGFDSLFKCLCSNNNATITDLSEHCTTEKGKKGHCLCNLTGKEPKESILKDCLSHKNTFCSGYKIINQQGHCNKTLCMAAVMNCKVTAATETGSEDPIIQSNTNTRSTNTITKMNITDHITKSTSVMPDEYENKINKYFCQGETLIITCPNNFVISFDDANFGRGHSDSERCSEWFGFETKNCNHHEQTLKVLNDKCHEQQKCLLPVSKDIFGKPCRGVTKYLNVSYHCQRKDNHGLDNSDNSANIDQTTYDGQVIDIRDDRKSKLDRKDRNNDRKKHSRNSDITTDSDQTALDENENKNDRWNRRKNRWDRKDDRKKQAFKVGAIVGISVGISCTLILGVVIMLVIYVCRRRSKKKKRKQRFEMAHLESGPSCSNKEQYTIPSTNKSLNTDKAQGEYFALDPSFTKYDKDLSNRKLPEIKRCSGADGDDNVYYEIDEDNINSSSDMEGVHQKKIEVMDQGSHPNDLIINQTQLGSMENNTEQLTRQQLVDQGYEMSNFEINHSGTNKEGTTFLSENKLLTTDEAQGDYFVLDPSVTKYDKDMVIPEVDITSVAQGAETVYNEIDEDPIEPPTVIKVDHQKQMEEATDIAIYHTDLTNHETKIGFDNSTYNVTSEVDDIIF